MSAVGQITHTKRANVLRDDGDHWMREYKLYCLDSAGRIQHRHEFEAEDDQHALELASARDDAEVDCELWQGPRRVAFIPATNTQAG